MIGMGGAGNTLDAFFFDFRPKVHTNISKAGCLRLQGLSPAK